MVHTYLAIIPCIPRFHCPVRFCKMSTFVHAWHGGVASLSACGQQLHARQVKQAFFLKKRGRLSSMLDRRDGASDGRGHPDGWLASEVRTLATPFIIRIPCYQTFARVVRWKGKGDGPRLAGRLDTIFSQLKSGTYTS
jgi:hypothetical protein